MSKLTDNIEENLTLFVQETAQTQVVWGLKNEEEGWLSCDSTEFEESEVMPFWSSKADAEIHNIEEWSDFVVTEIPLDMFLEEWLKTLSEDGVLLGLNWNAALDGKELEPLEVAKLFI